MIQPLRVYKASAGSGKTFTLAVEYISLLAINPMEYQNILAVTFTNKATAEMKQRILGTLYGIAHGLPSAEAYIAPILASAKEKLAQPHYSGMEVKDQATLRLRAKEALSNIIHDYSRFHIETIDSFFQSILHEIANEMDLSANMRVELDDGQALGDAVDSIIENMKEGSDEFKTIVNFIDEKIASNRSWKVDATVKDFGQNIFKEKYLIHGDDVRKAITDQSSIHQFRAIINEVVDKQKHGMTELAKEMVDTCDDIDYLGHDGVKDIINFLNKVACYDVKEPESSNQGTFSDKKAEYIVNSDKWFKKNAKKKGELQPQVESLLMPKLEELFDMHTAYLSDLHTVNAIKQHLYSLMLLNKISETVREQNNEKNRFLLSETANFLRDVINDEDIPFIYEKAGTVIKHIMIDEFQDTSTLQWSNFKPLIMNSMAAGGSCLIVGDVKQSIYRFRNSDWQILNNIEKEPGLQGMIGNIPAKYNYRSSRRVVEFNNALFRNATSLLSDTCPELDTAYGDVEQIAKKEKETGFVRVENIDYHGLGNNEDTEEADNEPSDQEGITEEWPYTLSDDISEAMLQRLKANVAELVSNGVNPNDITILTRTNKEVPAISDYFNEHQEDCPVKVVSDDAFRLDASPAVNIIISALRALEAEGDSMPLVCLAYSYAKSILHLDNPLSVTMRSTEEIEATLPEGFRFYERERLRMKSLAEQVEDIYRIFELNTLEGQDAYMFCFHDMLARFCSDNQASASLFIQNWDDKLCETTIPNGAADGVRIMTMHKSKGLEFHTVIIPSCMWGIAPKANEVMWCVPSKSPYNKMPLLPVSVSRATDDSIFAADRQEEELKTLVDNINVLYVAFTRAKHNLIILTGNKLDAGYDSENTDNAQTFIIESMPDYMTVNEECDRLLSQWQCGTIVSTEEKSDKGATDENHNMLESEYSPLNAPFVSNGSVAEFRQSYESDMFITADADDMKTKMHQEKIRLISLGNLYHNIFQMVHTAADVPHAVRMLETKGCFESLVEADEAQETVARLIKDISVTHPEWFAPEWRVLNERTILFSQDELYMTKRPDRVIVNGRQAIIIDYKTARGAVKRTKSGKLSAPAENVSQIKDYERLLSEMGYEDIRAYLWYIFDDTVIEVDTQA